MAFGARLKANQAITSNQFQDVNDLMITLPPDTHFYFRFFGAYTSAAATTGLQLSVTGPASPTFLAFAGQIHTGATAVFGGVGNAYDAGISATAGSTAAMPFWLDGSISTGAAGGIFRLRCRSEVNGSAVTLLRGTIALFVAVDG
jgi:hypothetical protein